MIEIFTAIILVIALFFFIRFDGFNVLETNILKAPSNIVAIISLVLVPVSLALFLIGNFGYSGFELVFKHHLILPVIIFIVHLLIIFFIFFSYKIPDGLRYAVLFLIINTVTILTFYIFGMPKEAFQGSITMRDLVTGSCPLMISLLVLLLISLQATKAKPKNSFFKMASKMGEKIQRIYDQSEN